MHRYWKMFLPFWVSIDIYILIHTTKLCANLWSYLNNWSMYFIKWPIIEIMIIIQYVLKLISAVLVPVDLHILYEICFLLFWPNVTSPSKLVSPNVPWAMSECHQMTLSLFMVRKYRKYCNDILSVCSVFNDGKINSWILNTEY